MKIGGVYILTLRSIKRLIAVIAAAFAAACASASTPKDMVLAGRYANAAQSLLSMRVAIEASGSTRIAVPDVLYLESKALYLTLKSSSPVSGNAVFAAPVGRESPPRRYSVRKALTVPLAAEITGLSESTIKRLDKDPRNTNYPGRNSTPQMLAAWARLYRDGKSAAREVRAANRPVLGRARC